MALSVTNKPNTTKLVVKPLPAPKAPLKVTTNTGWQKTAPASILQGSNQQTKIQGSSYQVQGGNHGALQGGNANTLQPVATSAEIAKAALVAELARQKEVSRSKKQGEINSSVASNKSAIELKVQQNSAWKGKISWAKIRPPKLLVPEQTFTDVYNFAYRDAYEKALKEYGDQRDGSKILGLASGWDKISFGQDRRDMKAREWSQKRLETISDTKIGEYDTKLQTFLQAQASRRAQLEGKKFGTMQEYEQEIKSYEDWEKQWINSLEKERASVTAMIDVFGQTSQAKLTSAVGKVGNAISKIPQKLEDNRLWKYTLGGGSENIPSITTAPSRLLNWAGNINTKDRVIQKHGGETLVRAGSDKNAWQSTFNQRNINTKPWVDVTLESAPQQLKDEAKQIIELRKQHRKYATDDKKLNYEAVLQEKIDTYNKNHRAYNTALELAADPLLIAGAAGKTGTTSKAIAKATSIASETKGLGWIPKTASTIKRGMLSTSTALKETKIVKWLGSEAKTPEQKLKEIAESYATKNDELWKTVYPELKRLNEKMPVAQRLDISVFEDLANLTESEIGVLQRTKAGRLSGRDRAFLAGKNYEPIRSKIETIAQKWNEFSEQMRAADNVTKTRFGGKNRLYSPRSVIYDELDDYDFRMFKKSKYQNKSDFLTGVRDRYFKSDLDEAWSKKQMDRVGAGQTRRKELINRVETELTPIREQATEQLKKVRSKTNKVRRIAGAPMRLWKDSVLGRPAWTVNNAIYNTKAGVLASGSGSLVEQAKMLNPRYWRKAMDESRAVFGSNIGKEIPKAISKNPLSRVRDKWYKFNTGVEDWSRVAAGRTALKKGLSEEKSLERVNKYLFDYTTKNWEKPLKTVMPFWSWQKNIAKASVKMPFDKPSGAVAYNRTDMYQQNQFEKEFKTVVGELKNLGYTDDQIAEIKKEQEKYYKGRLKVGNKWYNTPFNAFSEKGMSGAGMNPFLAAYGETASATDSFGSTVKGTKASFFDRLRSKFPQAEIAAKWLDRKKNTERYIGEAGSEGYGFTKEKQGFDKTKPNYVRSMDQRAKLGQDALSFVGVPRGLEFDKNKLVETKKLQKVTETYFGTDWDEVEKKLGYEERVKQQEEIFKKYGITADDFYKGILSKYDSDQTIKIKAQKEEARTQNSSLFEEYSKQPKGTRNLWAVNKLKELNAAGYFDKNPFLKSFDWITPEGVKKADKQAIVKKAVETGDWSAYRKQYGSKKSAKSVAWAKAKKSNDWTAYRKEFGGKSSPFKFEDKYFKTAESMEKYKEGMFWKKYSDASKNERKKLLAENPSYNRRSGWTNDQWDQWKTELKKSQTDKLKKWKAGSIERHIATNREKAREFNRKRGSGKKAPVWKLS